MELRGSISVTVKLEITLTPTLSQREREFLPHLSLRERSVRHPPDRVRGSHSRKLNGYKNRVLTRCQGPSTAVTNVTCVGCSGLTAIGFRDRSASDDFGGSGRIRTGRRDQRGDPRGAEDAEHYKTRSANSGHHGGPGTVRAFGRSAAGSRPDQRAGPKLGAEAQGVGYGACAVAGEH